MSSIFGTLVHKFVYHKLYTVFGKNEVCKHMCLNSSSERHGNAIRFCKNQFSKKYERFIMFTFYLTEIIGDRVLFTK